LKIRASKSVSLYGQVIIQNGVKLSFYSNLQKASSQTMLIWIQGEQKLNRIHRPKCIKDEC